MSKGGLALSSLVMAIPAGFLTYLCVMSVFEHNESMPVLVTIIVWTLIVLGLLIAISPIIFMIAGPKAAVAAPVSAVSAAAPAVDSKKKPSRKKSEDDEFGEVADNAGDEQLFDASDEEIGADDYEDNFNFDEDEELEEEPAPKKKKKK